MVKTRLSIFLKKEAVFIILLSLIVGILAIAPPLGIRKSIVKNGDKFVLALLTSYRDTVYTYIPRAREVYDGHFLPSDLSMENRGATPLNALPSLIFGGLIALFNGSINNAYLLAQFLFSAFIFILLYLLGKNILYSSRWALLFAVFGTLTPVLTNVFSFDFKDDLKILFDYTFKQFVPFVRTQMDQLRVARIDQPLLTYPFYLSAIFLYLRFWERPSTKSAIFAAIPAGLLAYVYFHHWIYWSAVLGLTFIYALVRRNIDPVFFKKTLLLLGILGVLLVPYFINYVAFRSLPSADDISYRLAAISGREIGIARDNISDYLIYIVLAVLVIATYFWKKFALLDFSISKKRGWLFLIFLGAAVIVWNLQLIIGQSASPPKWRYPISVALYLIFFSLIVNWAIKIGQSRVFLKKAIIVGSILLSTLVTAKYTVNAISIWISPSAEILSSYRFSNDVVDSWQWINRNLPHEPKIISPSYITSVYLMSYTSARPFLPRGHLSLASNFELEERLIVARKLFGISEENFRQQIEQTAESACGASNCFPSSGMNVKKTQFQLYGDGYKKSFSQYMSGASRLPKEKTEELEELIRRFQNKTVDWKNIDADYAYLGPWELELGSNSLSGNKNLELVYSNKIIGIFKIKKNY